MAEVTLPGYEKVTEIADRIGVSPGRVRQLLAEYRALHGEELGYLVGTVRLFSATDTAKIERLYAGKRKYVRRS